MPTNKPVIGFEDNLTHNYQEYAPTMYAVGKLRAARTPYDIDDTVIQDANKLFKPGLFVMTQGTTNVVPSYTLTANDVCYLYNLLPDPDDSLNGGHVEGVDIHNVPMHVRQIAYLYLNGELSVKTRVGVKSPLISPSSSSTIQHISDVTTLTASSDWSYRFVYELGYWIRYKTVANLNVWEPALAWTDWVDVGGGSGSTVTPTHNPVEFLGSSKTADVNTIYVSFSNATLTLPDAATCTLGDTVRLDQWQTNGSVAGFNGSTIETTPNQIQTGSTDFTWSDPTGVIVHNTLFRDNSDGSWTATAGATVYTIQKNSANRFVLTDSVGTLIAVKDLTNATTPWSENTAGQNVWTFQSPGRSDNVTMVRGVAYFGCNTYEFEVTYDGFNGTTGTKIWIQKNSNSTATVTTYDFNDHNGVQLGYNGDKLTVSGTSAAPGIPGTVMTTQTLSRMASNVTGYNNTVPTVTATYNAISLVSAGLTMVSSSLNSHILNHPSGGSGGDVTLTGAGVVAVTPTGTTGYEIGLNWSSTNTNGIRLNAVSSALVAEGIVADIGQPGVVKTLNEVATVADSANPYTVPTVNAVSAAITLISSYIQMVSSSVSDVNAYTDLVSAELTNVSAACDTLDINYSTLSADYALTSADYTLVSDIVHNLVIGGGGGGSSVVTYALPLSMNGTELQLKADYSTHSGVILSSTGSGSIKVAGVPASNFASNVDAFGVVKTLATIPTDAIFASSDYYNGSSVTNPGDKYVVPTVIAVQNYVDSMVGLKIESYLDSHAW